MRVCRAFLPVLASVVLGACGGGTTTPPPADTTAPTLASGSPTGTLAAGTTSTTLSVTTSENATCRYATTAGTAYAAMTNTFSTTGGTSHSTTLSGLANGQTYNRYVRCIDSAGNANAADYTATFSVASATSDAAAPSVPTGLTATAVSSSQINLSWTASTDNVGVAGYRIFRGGTQIASVTSGTIYQHTALSPSTAYTYTVSAYDAAANTSAQSTSASATTQSGGGTPQTQRLIQASNITYVGAFKVPTGDAVRCDANTGSHCFLYGGTALGYNPTNNSLFFGGHDYAQQLGEIKIPSVINTSQTALVLQNLIDVTEGKLGTICSNPRNNKLGGSLVYNNRLITTAFVYYGPDCTQTKSHGASGLNLSITNDFPAFYSMNAAEPRGVSGWMTLIPPEWQALLGGPALTGHCCSPGPQDTSNGPAAIVFNPNDVGVTNPIPGTALIYYPFAPFPGHPLAKADTGNLYYNLATQMGGMAFPPGSRSVLFFGRQGTGPYCYGPGTSDPNLAGQPAPGGVDTWCFDPSDSAKGTHAYPYRHQVWAYDANDLLAVKNGTKQTWEVIPQVWELTGMDSSGGAKIRGATYDQATGRLYITQGYGDNPQVDVYQITVPGSTPPPPSTSE